MTYASGFLHRSRQMAQRDCSIPRPMWVMVRASINTSDGCTSRKAASIFRMAFEHDRPGFRWASNTRSSSQKNIVSGISANRYAPNHSARPLALRVQVEAPSHEPYVNQHGYRDDMALLVLGLSHE